MDSVEDFLAIFKDPIYLRDVVPDEKKFIARDKSVLLIGEEQVKYENGVLGEGIKLQL